MLAPEVKEQAMDQGKKEDWESGYGY